MPHTNHPDTNNATQDHVHNAAMRPTVLMSGRALRVRM